MIGGLQSAPLPVTVEVEPAAPNGRLAYSLLAPKALGQKPRVMIAIMLRITNNGPESLTFRRLRFSFLGPPFVAQTVYQQEDVLQNELQNAHKITSGNTRNIHFSRLVTITFTSPAPPAVTLRIGFEETPQEVTVFRHLVRHENPVKEGAYRLPFRASDLALPGVVTGSSGHKGSNQRFAHDTGAMQWDPAEASWRGLKPGSTENTNENQVDWELPIYAMADGEVLGFANDQPDNPDPPEKITGGGGNHYWIRHGTERVLYAHLREGRLNPDLLAVGATVAEGQYLGRMGNSGSSTVCHLHIHALDDASGAFRPLQFRDGWVVDRSSVDPRDLSAPWVKLEGHGLPFDANAIWPSPHLPVVIKRLGSAESLPTGRFCVLPLASNLLVTALQASDGRLRLLASSLSSDGRSLGFLGDSEDQAGRIGVIDIVTLGFGMVATAVNTAEGRLKLIVWRVADGGSVIERLGDSGNSAGTADVIALASLGTGHLVTAVRSAEGREKVIVWHVSGNGGQLQRLGDSGSHGIECDRIAAAPAGLGRFVTALRASDQRLLVEVWEVSADGQILTRRSDSAGQAGIIGDVRVLSLSSSQAVTAVRTGSDRLKLIVWAFDDAGIVSRTGDSGEQAGIAQIIALTSPAPGIVVTAVVTAEGNLKLIAWHVDADSVVTRLGDSGQQAGETGFMDVVALGPERLVTGVRTVSGRFKLIAWSLESVGGRRLGLAADFARHAGALQLSAFHEDLDEFTSAADDEGATTLCG